MSLLFIVRYASHDEWKEIFKRKDPDLDIEFWPNVKDNKAVTFAVCWNHPKNLLDSYPNLQAVSSLGAGVNHLIDDEWLAPDIPIVRVITPSLKKQMADYILNAVLNYRNNTLKYAFQKKDAKWDRHKPVPKADCTVGIMGLGELGQEAARLLVKNGYKVNGWSRTAKDIEGVTSYTEHELDAFLAATNIPVCLLPLTGKTEGILDLELFKKLKKPSYVINAGRGSHLVEEDLIYALDTGQLSGACLDVFENEPLPPAHVFWNRPNITVTPHIAAQTDPDEGAELILENYKRALSGMKLLNEVDRKQEY